jgi:selenocysteine-specific elongation factor
MMIQKTPDILHAIVGTAGHVDHGKTALVKQLTGVDTDRLPEEKARGMSIDLGFAPYVLSDGRWAGVVDVPGHKDFIRNMVPGAASIDVLVMVIAADDGIMPQTHEHMLIVQLLRISRVMVVVTKVDLVSEAQRGTAVQQAREFLARWGYPDAPIAAVSNKTGEGLPEAKLAIEALICGVADEARREPATERPFRMNVERVFAIKGHGTVVTGIPLAGEIGLEDKLELLPSGKLTSLRAIQTYKLEAHRGHSHACVALNVRDLSAESVSRGMTLGAPGMYEASSVLVGTLRNASDAAVITKRHRVMFHAGTSVTAASMGLIGADELKPGQQAFVRAKLQTPVVLCAGDRFIIRSMSPAMTLGGGTVLGTRVTKLRRGAPVLLAALQQAASALQQGDVMSAALRASVDSILTHRQLRLLTQLREGPAEQLISNKQADGTLVSLGEEWLVRDRLVDWVARTKLALHTFHLAHKCAWGMTAQTAFNQLGIRPKSFKRWAEELARVDTEISLQHGCLALSGHRPELTEQQLGWMEAISKSVTAAGIRPPARGDLRETLGLSQSDMNTLVRLLCDEGVVVALRGHVISAEVFYQCRDRLIQLFENRPIVDVQAFREATNVSRRVAVELLEAWDAQGLTRREQQGRVLVKAPDS